MSKLSVPILNEPVVLTFLKKNYPDWKELVSFIMEDTGIMQFIPLSEDKDNWSKMIFVQYGEGFDISQENQVSFFLNILNQKMALDNAPNIFSWNVIEKDTNSALYETIVSSKKNEIFLEHEIAVIYLTKHGLYRASYNQKNEKISDLDKEKWIENIKKLIKVMLV